MESAELSLGVTAGYEKRKGVKDVPGVWGLSIWVNDTAISEAANTKEGRVWAGGGT